MKDLELRAAIGQNAQPFGRDLAGKVADALKKGSLAYGHRDYCGMGLEIRNEIYCYGELWDGYMNEPVLSWPDRQAFIDWLSVQSDASLGRLDEKDPWYWGNQTIDSRRLEEFVG